MIRREEERLHANNLHLPSGPFSISKLRWHVDMRKKPGRPGKHRYDAAGAGPPTSPPEKLRRALELPNVRLCCPNRIAERLDNTRIAVMGNSPCPTLAWRRLT